MSESELHAQAHEDLNLRLAALEKFANDIRGELSKLQGHIYAGATICGGIIGLLGWVLK